MRGPYKPVVYSDFSGGLNTRLEDNRIGDNQSPDLQNVVFDGAGSWTPRQGNTLFGTSTSATGSIRNTWTTANTREEIPLRIQAAGTIEYYNPQTAAWETLDTGYTANMDFGHCDYNYYTYYSNQKDNQRRWNAVVWRTSTYADSAYAAVDLSTSAASAIGFLSAGSVVIDGEEVYYSSRSGTRLSGITFTTSHNGGVGIAQLPTSANEAPAPDGGWASASSALPKGSIMLEMDAQIFVAGASGVSGNIVYYSAVDEPTNYTISAKPGGGGSARYPETLGSITGLSRVPFEEVLEVFKQNTIRQLKFQDLADGTAGSLEIVSRNEVVTSPKVGVIKNKSLISVENNLTYVTPAGWVKTLGSTDANAKINTEISRFIRPTVESYNMTSSTACYFAGKYYLACATSASSFNNVVLLWDYDYQAWSKFVGWNVGDWFIYNNALYFGASNEIATYKALQGYDDNSQGYAVNWSSKQIDFGIPEEQKRLNQIYIEGYIGSNASIGVSAYFDNNTGSGIPKSIEGTGNYVVTNDTINVLGSTIWGQGLFGSGQVGSSYTLYKFRWWGKYSAQPFYTLQIKMGATNPGFVYKIQHIVPYLQAIPGKKVPINSIV